VKIFVLPVPPELQPQSTVFAYPAHNKGSYGIEQDFLRFLEQNPGFVTNRPGVADWHYLPIYWTWYHWNHSHGKTGLEFLQQQVLERTLNEDRTFTICQDSAGPLVDLGRITKFFSSRRGKSFDVPLLVYPYKTPSPKPRKKWLASFVGRLGTYPTIRFEMQCLLGKRDDTDIRGSVKSLGFFVNQMLQSYIALSPRGYGPTSFRFYEAMQLGIVPLLISDIDTRPFKAFLDWDQMSFYASSAEEAEDILNSFSSSVEKLLQMGELAQVVWYQDLAFGKWCKYVIKELEIFGE